MSDPQQQDLGRIVQFFQARPESRSPAETAGNVFRLGTRMTPRSPSNCSLSTQEHEGHNQKYSQEDELPGYSGLVVGPRFSETGFGWITNNCPS